MARDMAKKNVADYRWTKENCKMFSVKIRNDSGIIEALETATSTAKMSKNAYIVSAVYEKLISDGYLSSEPEQVSKED